MIRAIIFDCFGVLVDEAWVPFRDRYFKTAEDQRWSRQMMRRVSGGEVSHEELADVIEEKTGVKAENFLEILHTNPPNEDLLNYIPQLKTRGYKIGLLSNVGSNYLHRLLTEEQLNFFDDKTLSYEAGMTKPDRGIYMLSAKSLGVDPAECVFVDDVETYCQGASAVGMKSIHYQDFSQFKRQLEKLVV